MKGVADKTNAVLQVLMSYPELSRYNLVGGTAVAIQIDHRLSEDIDLFFYNPFPGTRQPLPHFEQIMTRLRTDFTITALTNMDKYSARLALNEVKVDLHSENQFHGPKAYSALGTIRLPDKVSLLGMKLVTMALRNNWRDVYDVFCLAEEIQPAKLFPAFKAIMSSNYCGKGAGKKEALYNTVIMKLSDLNGLQKLFNNDDLEHLQLKKPLTPQMVVEKFSLLPKLQVSKGKGFSF